jgi:hypothetical protein
VAAASVSLRFTVLIVAPSFPTTPVQRERAENSALNRALGSNCMHSPIVRVPLEATQFAVDMNPVGSHTYGVSDASLTGQSVEGKLQRA